MEALTFPSYLLPLLLLPFSLYLFSIIRRKSSDDRKNLPPGSRGWPVVGENIKFALLGPEKFIKDRMEKHSPEVFQTSLLGERVATFCGAKGNKFLFTNGNKLVTSWWPQSMKKVLSFPEFVDSNLKVDSALKRTLHRDVFTPEALKRHVAVMDALAREHLERHWKPNSVVKVLGLSRKYTFELACRVFLSEVDPVRIQKLSDPFNMVSEGMISVPLDLPGTAYNRAIKGGKLVREELMRIIQERRKELMEKPERRDLLSKMLLLRDDDGRPLNEKQICNDIIGSLVASYDTTSSALTSVINYLAQLPHIYNQVFKEQMAIAESKGPNELLTWDDIEKMKYSWNVVRESMRLTPPAAGAFREATTEFSYAGFTIPKGWKTFWTVHSSHKNPDYFPEPERFDPSRFEGSGPPPYTFVPFGGGPRMCAGREYARLEMLVMMHNVVTRFKLEKVIPNEKINYHASPTPVYGLPLHLHPHKK
ncbi:beta-amyrin 6-beta-monooxygenase-like [Salvia miltiorrhiza]|uniref:beta-amyrin 6-beta-monooxygenase-like n=1 Tax=Salvia miltiorrhiza TaxID=226208 RepID=UPI0025AB6402|nr:beta-amyrin 6-beta-monooxygenase-like [Salvia miltiorrhiza]